MAPRPISEAMVEVGADTKPFAKQMKGALDKLSEDVQKVAEQAERTIAKAFSRASQDVRKDLAQLGNTKAFTAVQDGAVEASSELVSAFAAASEQAGEVLADVGGGEVFEGVAASASKASDEAVSRFSRAASGIDRAISGSGGEPAWATVVTNAGAAGARAAARFSSALGGAITTAVGHIGREVGDLLSSSLRAAATVGTGILGASLIGGFNRLKAIDDARGKLKGLGHDAEAVEAIMDSALESVTGTAFGLGDAAGLAAGAVAAGIDPGEELTEYLTTIADTAAIAGTDLGDIGTILNRIRTGTGKFTMELNQLSDRELPVVTWLANAFDKTEGEIREMVAAGKISAEEFEEVLRDNIGGAAQAAGETFSGGLANTKAAMGRLGANFLEPFFVGTHGAFPALIEIFNAISDAIEPIMKDLAESEGFQRVLDFLGKIPELIGNFSFDKIGEFSEVVGVASGLLVSFGSSALTNIPLVGGLIPAIGPLIGIFGGLVAASPELREVLGETFSMLSEAAGPILEALMPALEAITGAIGELVIALAPVIVDVMTHLTPTLILLAEVFADVVIALAPLIAMMGGLFAEVLQAVAPILGELAEVMAPVLVQLAIGLVGALEALAPAFSAILPVVTKIISIMGNTLGTYIEALIPAFLVLAETVAELVVQMAPMVEQFLDALAPILPELAESVAALMVSMVELLAAITPLIPPLLQLALLLLEKIGVPAIIAISAALARVAETMSRLAEVVGRFISGVADKLSRFFSKEGFAGGLDAVRDAFSRMGEKAREILDNIGRWFSDLPTNIGIAIGKIVSFFLNLPFRILEALVELPGILYDALTGPVADAVGEAIDFLTSIPGKIAELPGLIIEKIPEMAAAAASWAEGFLTGLVDALGGVISGAKSLVESLLGVLKSVWNGLVDMINEAWNAVSFEISAFGFTRTIGLPTDIPADHLKLARGAVVDGPTFAMIGDATRGDRRESVLPHNDPARAVALARQGGLDEVLRKGGLFGQPETGGMTVEAGAITVQAAPEPMKTATNLLDDLALATWMRG